MSFVKWLVQLLFSVAWTGFAVWFFLFSPMNIGAKTFHLAPGVYCTGFCPGVQSPPLSMFALGILPVIDGMLLLVLWGAVLGLVSNMRDEIPGLLLISCVWMGIYAAIFWLA